jgi:hypothetical protein
MGEEVCCSSSRSHVARLAGAVCRGRITRSWQELCAGDQLSVCVREAQYVRGRPARAQQRSVRVRTGRVYEYGVLARRQETIYADAGRVHGRVCARGQRVIDTDTI